jgi:hypothetical protein
MLCSASFVVGFFDPTGLHLVGEDGTITTPFSLLHLGGFGFFAVTDISWSNLLFAVGFEATVLEDLTIDDTTAVFVSTIGTDYFYLVVEVDIELD